MPSCSQRAPQNSGMWSTDHACSAAYPSRLRPCVAFTACMKRYMFDSRTLSTDGFHNILAMCPLPRFGCQTAEPLCLG